MLMSVRIPRPAAPTPSAPTVSAHSPAPVLRILRLNIADPTLSAPTLQAPSPAPASLATSCGLRARAAQT